MFYLLNIGQPLYHFIITASKPVHDRILFAAFFNSDYNFIAVLPLSDILWNQFHRILKIRYHTDHAVSGYLEHSIIGGIKLAEILCIEDSLDAAVFTAEPAKNRPRIIR